jgi:hypothetical protein
MPNDGSGSSEPSGEFAISHNHWCRCRDRRRCLKESKMAKERSKTAGDRLRDRISEAKSRFQGRTPRTRTRKRPQARGSMRGRLRRK